MTVYATTTTTDKRATAARAIVEQHLAHRDERLIVGRVTRTGVRVWLVNGHTVTLDPVVTCDCPDMMHRHPAHGCKHVQAVRLLTTKPAPAPVPAPTRRPVVRTEWVEEI